MTRSGLLQQHGIALYQTLPRCSFVSDLIRPDVDCAMACHAGGPVDAVTRTLPSMSAAAPSTGDLFRAPLCGPAQHRVCPEQLRSARTGPTSGYHARSRQPSRPRWRPKRRPAAARGVRHASNTSASLRRFLSRGRRHDGRTLRDMRHTDRMRSAGQPSQQCRSGADIEVRHQTHRQSNVVHEISRLTLTPCDALAHRVIETWRGLAPPATRMPLAFRSGEDVVAD